MRLCNTGGQEELKALAGKKHFEVPSYRRQASSIEPEGKKLRPFPDFLFVALYVRSGYLVLIQKRYLVEIM
jgi:pantothenate kinase